MAKHDVPRGETGTKTQGAHKTSKYEGKHREGVAEGSSAQKGRTTPSDLPHRDGRPGNK